MSRAYRWILSNPDASYKAYFRDSYEAFALASGTHLHWLRSQVLRQRYEPTHASKIFIPKASGTLRPITLLTVEDQIVYQVCVGVIAEALRKRTRHRYGTTVFAHLYAGSSSQFFYKQWKKSYRQYGNAIEGAYDSGLRYIANFDLASFYDSIDHQVIRHFLGALKIDFETIDLLIDCLKKWTSSTWDSGPSSIYHGHGIPQGPLSSGMLSEAVLTHIDEAGERSKTARYFRYVDDIKIVASNEFELRRRLIALDLAAKEIGLFPQTSKINIRKISDPKAEVNSVSRPPEPSVSPVANQGLLVKRLLEITKRGLVPAEMRSRFRYLLAQAEPTHRLNARLMEVLRRHPEHFASIESYIGRYKKVPLKLAIEIRRYLIGGELYHEVSAGLLRSTLGRMPNGEAQTIADFCKSRLFAPKGKGKGIQAAYREALISWVLAENKLTHAQFEKLLFNEPDWWVRKRAFGWLEPTTFGMPSHADICNRLLRVDESESSLVAAAALMESKAKLTKPYGDVADAGKRSLKAVGIIKQIGRPASLVGGIVAYVLPRKKTKYDWRKFFGKKHRHGEYMAILLKKYREVNIDAFLVQFDSFADYVTRELFERLVPGKVCPAHGAAVHHPVLLAKLPKSMQAFDGLHQLRLKSTTAHPTSKKTGGPTRRLKHADYFKIRKRLIAAFDEIENAIVP